MGGTIIHKMISKSTFYFLAFNDNKYTPLKEKKKKREEKTSKSKSKGN